MIFPLNLKNITRPLKKKLSHPFERHYRIQPIGRGSQTLLLFYLCFSFIFSVKGLSKEETKPTDGDRFYPTVFVHVNVLL